MAKAKKAPAKAPARSRGSVLLERYMKKQGLSCRGLADKLDCSRGHAGMLKKGDKRPGLSLALRIAALTGGGVPVEAWDK